MKRRLTKLVVFLLLGAIVNVAVAWTIALWARTASGKVSILTGDTAEQVWSSRFAYGGSFQESTGFHHRLHRVYGFGYSGYWARCAEATGIDMIVVLDVGCPLRCLSGEVRTDLYGVLPNEVVHALVPPKTVGPLAVNDDVPRCIPLQPRWPGFAINTVFYAAILWMPFAPFVLRRFIRRKRGRCITCGYDLRHVEHEVCPECGLDRRSPLAMRICPHSARIKRLFLGVAFCRPPLFRGTDI